MSRRVRARLAGFAVAVALALPLLPEIVGSRRLVFRDAQITHWPWRREAVRALASGRVPFVNASASGGEPLLANPNAVILYPTFWLEKFLSPGAAFNLHYLLHVFWAFLGARVLARRLGLSENAALFSGVAYGFSGMMLSYGSAFMNSSAAAAWLPWCAAAFADLGAARRPRDAVRAAAAAGLALGLQLLAGEPAITLVTLGLGAGLLAAAAAARPPAERARALGAAAIGSAGAGALGLGIAAPLLLPLSAVFSLTYRGQHLYSEKASGAASFHAERAVEWLLPRFGGSPDVLGGGANWLRAFAQQDFVYVWCVTLGVVPLFLLVLAGLRRGFWDRRAVLLAAAALVALLFAFGFALPFYRLVFAIGALRKLRYPIKFYLLTTVLAALLAGLAAEALSKRRPGRREAALLALWIAACGVAWIAAAPGGALERWAAPLAARVSDDPAAFVAVFRGLVRGDALVGAVAALLAGVVLRIGPRREPSVLLAALALATSLWWGLPLFVTADARDLDRAPALARHLGATGRLYVSARLPRFDPAALRPAPGELPRTSRLARVVLEQLVPGTGSPFGVRYLFETDPDGSYGYFNRVASEAADASPPLERDRLLVAFGARWTLALEGEDHPLFSPVTGVEVAGRRLVLSETAAPVPELRWAGRAWRRPGLSPTLELVRSAAFDPRGGVALPGRAAAEPAERGSSATLSNAVVEADRASAVVEADGSGHLVFSRTFFPAWRAQVDGATAPVVVANGRDLAVAVPAGRHRVDLWYDPSPFRAGAAVQAAAFLAALGAAVATRRGRPRSGHREQSQVHQQPQVDVGPAAV
jgi:hypothetical protein